MRRTGLLLLAALAALGLTSDLHALDIPSRPDGYVTDKADILSPEAQARVESVLRQYEDRTSNQVIVATFPSLEGESLEDYSIRLAERWKPGQQDRNNGVILLIFRDDRQIRIEVGYGLEGALPDVLAGRIIQEEIAPRFRDGRYEEGVLHGLQAILQAISGEYQPNRHRASYDGPRELTAEEVAELRRQGLVWGGLIAIALLGLFLYDVARYGHYLRDHRTYKERYTFWEWFFRFAVLLAVLSFIFRMIFYRMLTSRGGYSGSGGGGGGFRGGGGSFGGGGASGRW